MTRNNRGKARRLVDGPVILVLACGMLLAIATASSAEERGPRIPEASWGAASSVSPADVARDLQTVAGQLGIAEPAADGSPPDTLAVIRRLEVLSRSPSPSSAPWFPHAAIQHLALAAEALPSTVWSEGSYPLDPADRALLSLVATLAHDTAAKLDRLRAQRLRSRRELPRATRETCRNARPIEDGTSATVVLQSAVDGRSRCGLTDGSPGTWLRYVAPRDGIASFTSDGNSVDTVLSVQDGCPDVTSRELACNDDRALSVGSRAAVQVTEGQEIWLRVAGNAGAEGSVAVQATTGGGIAGTVRAKKDGTPVADASVSIWEGRVDIYTFVTAATTGADGTYAIGELDPAPDYLMVVRHPEFVDQLYEGLPCLESACSSNGATPITVDTSGIQTVDVDLEKAGAIAGNVSPTVAGGGMPHGTVITGRIDGRNVHWGHDTAETKIQPYGSYLLENLPPGDYWVRTWTDFSDEVYDDTLCGHGCDPTIGQPVKVREETTRGVNFDLEAGGSIEGTVVSERVGIGLDAVQVVFWDEAETYGNGTITGSDGTFLVPNLDPGGYYLRVCEYGCFAEDYDDVAISKPCKLPGSPLATLVQVNAATITSGIEIALRSEGTISGRILEKETGKPVVEPAVRVRFGGGQSRRLIDPATGSYLVEGLGPDDYVVEAGSDSGDYQVELYDDVPCAHSHCSDSTGNPVHLSLGAVRTGIDFLLSLCGDESYLTVTGPVNAPNTWSACEEITAGPMQIEPGGDVHLIAGRAVVLQNGFVVDSGGKLRIEIVPRLSGKDP